MKHVKNILTALNSKYLYACAMFFTIPCIAEASEAGSTFKEGVGKIAGLIMVVAFLTALVVAVAGGVKFSKGEKETGKMMLIGGGITAAAVVLVTILFSAFGMEDATTTASFDF